MPRLKDVTVHVEYTTSNQAYREYGTRYDDGYVETYIAVPDHDQGFLVHLKSHKFIAPGLAMFVFVDGNLHCNRNRVNLRPTKSGEDPRYSEVEFYARQKETKHPYNGMLIGRSWQFTPCNCGQYRLYQFLIPN